MYTILILENNIYCSILHSFSCDTFPVSTHIVEESVRH